ncbi:MAG: class I SAM-dependent methyltransferase [Actinobacteria bacterium]|nr:class I SAM-dependent methyltransferase [Actinomycetota bacterium]
MGKADSQFESDRLGGRSVEEAKYDRLGRGYSARRATDPRIAAAIDAALGDAGNVLNVGAGTGSYEPLGCTVAIEPSEVMIAQRPAGSAPAFQGTAEDLPFFDDSFDAVMAIFTDHHWSDRAAGIRELRRVAREQVVVLNIDPAWTARFWLVRDYLPSFLDLIPTSYREHGYREQDLRDLLGEIEVRPVPIPHDCHDGFLQAYWRRPEAFLDAAVQSSISTFHVLPGDGVDAAMERLRADLGDGTWRERNADLLETPELDLGLRLAIAG